MSRNEARNKSSGLLPRGTARLSSAMAISSFLLLSQSGSEECRDSSAHHSHSESCFQHLQSFSLLKGRTSLTYKHTHTHTPNTRCLLERACQCFWFPQLNQVRNSECVFSSVFLTLLRIDLLLQRDEFTQVRTQFHGFTNQFSKRFHHFHWNRGPSSSHRQPN